MPWVTSPRPKRGRRDRLQALNIFITFFAAAVVLRLFVLQVIQHGFYAALAQDQHQLEEQLYPTRGSILVRDRDAATGTYPLATNQTLHLLYAVPKQVTDAPAVAKTLTAYIATPEEDLLRRLAKPNDLYEPLAHELTDEQMEKIKALKIPGLFFADEKTRYYTEKNIGSHLLGFMGYDGKVKKGRYGLEGAMNTELAGKQGYIKAQKDASGELIATAAQFWQPAINGSDLILTVDRTIQYEACTKLNEAVLKHGADGGSIVILDPKTGAVLAMCGAPDFDPNQYNLVKNAAIFANPATQAAYEPGSVFKAITMAAALDQGKVTPDSTYTDTGEVKIASFTIRNSDLKANGVQTMTEVLEKSLNTGAIFAMRQTGAEAFDRYLHNFGFGTATGVEISEGEGNIRSVDTGKDIYTATAAFGQGITVTPLQLAAAYGAIANGGKLMQPYVIDAIVHPDGTKTTTAPKTIRQVISPQTAATLGAMLVRVIQNGHGKRAGVPGYFVAGKTGTAQVPDYTTGKYQENVTIGTFAGFAPVDNPRFVMVVRLDHPRDVQFAESSAAPVFGEMAKFLMMYLGIPPAVTVPTP